MISPPPWILRKLDLFFHLLLLPSAPVYPLPCFTANQNIMRKESTMKANLLFQNTEVTFILINLIYKTFRLINSTRVPWGTEVQWAVQVTSYRKPWPHFCPSMISALLSSFWEAFRSWHAPGIILNRQFGCKMQLQMRFHRKDIYIMTSDIWTVKKTFATT